MICPPANTLWRSEGLRKPSAKALTLWAILVPLLTFHGQSFGQQSPVSEQKQPVTYLTLPIDTDVRPATLQLVRADDGNRYLAYNLFVSNWGKDLRLARLDVEEESSGRVLASYDAAALEDPFREESRQFGYLYRRQSPEIRILRREQTARIVIAVRLEKDAAPPAAIRHRIFFESDPGVRLIRDDGSFSQELVSVSPPWRIDGRAPVVLGAPLRNGPWRCGNGLGINSHNAMYVSGTARMRMPQRFGCDFLKVDPKGNILPNPFPNEITASMFYGYGEDVLAVADARVVETRDAIPEGVPQADGSVRMPVPLTEDSSPGNRVVLDLGGGRYAFYAHLIPGSIRVRPGDRVREGQVLGKVGMAGNATNPHLHFHVGNGPGLNGSEGMPYVFRRYILNGRGRPGGGGIQAQPISRAVPLHDSIMTFPDPKRSGRR